MKSHLFFRAGNRTSKTRSVFSFVYIGLAICLGSNAAAQRVEDADCSFLSSAIAGERYLWPKGVIPYKINENVGQQIRGAIHEAIEEYHNKTNLVFVERRNEKDYVEFIAATEHEICRGCGASRVGRQGGRQLIHLSQTTDSPTKIVNAGTVIHELAHMISLRHVQSRTDRDKYIRILWDNIEPSQRHNFEKHVTDGIDLGERYNYDSIMHYDEFAFGKIVDGKQMRTIVPRIKGVRLGNDRLSIYDVANINKLYPPVADKIGDGQPYLFHHPGFREGIRLLSSARHLRELDLDDRTTGIRVPEGWIVTLYRHPEFRGEKLHLVGPTEIPDLSKVLLKNKKGKPAIERLRILNWDNQASSIQVHGPGSNQPPQFTKATLFEHSYFRGRRIRLEDWLNDLSQSNIKFDDITSSIVVPGGVRVELFEHPGYHGKSILVVGPAVVSNVHQFQNENWGERVSSIKIFGGIGEFNARKKAYLSYLHELALEEEFGKSALQKDRQSGVEPQLQ